MDETPTNVPTHVCAECIAHTVLGPDETITDFHVRSFNDALIDIQFDLLQRAVVELRGDPEPSHRWSHHDIPDLIRALRESHAELLAAATDIVRRPVGPFGRDDSTAEERLEYALNRLSAAIEKAEAING